MYSYADILGETVIIQKKSEEKFLISRKNKTNNKKCIKIHRGVENLSAKENYKAFIQTTVCPDSKLGISNIVPRETFVTCVKEYS